MKKLILAITILSSFSAYAQSVPSNSNSITKVYYCYYDSQIDYGYTPVLGLKIINNSTGAVILEQAIGTVKGSPAIDNSKCIAQAASLNSGAGTASTK